MNVLLVKTEHEEDKSTSTLNMLKDDQGFIFRGTEQAEFVPGLRPAGLPHLLKTRDSAFLATDLLLRLRNWNADTVVLAASRLTTASPKARPMPSDTPSGSSTPPTPPHPRTRKPLPPSRTSSPANTVSGFSH
ncbi:isochorismatase family protein [Pseudarthrobacter sulfonivorans]|uniref:cysteine hydrolase family protein n=1 Tax=Pseudarthrobacter sulfonivorans TaxID=121292 RepID=UPI0028634A46|nr:isochorismatase family protein [Pseudarthrobacter sulfonivorans]MDR6417688.1 hypothetical protein [Pseudarthrobacter sulfonivorans]